MDGLNPITRKEIYLANLGGQDITPPDPVTRIERYLQDIIDGNASTIPPITRMEYYLAKISGADIAIPDPVTRTEYYLAAIAGMDIDVPDPITREEYFLAEWAENSSEHTYGPAALVSFETTKAKLMKSLLIDLQPLQDLHGYDSPWVDSAYNQAPYNFRAIQDAGMTRYGNSEIDKIVGGTVAWNQIAPSMNADNWRSGNEFGTVTFSDGIGILLASSRGGRINPKPVYNDYTTNRANHVILGTAKVKLTTATTDVCFEINDTRRITVATTEWQELTLVKKINSESTHNYIAVVDLRYADFDDIQVKDVNSFDLTQMFGSTIADYIYSLEQANAGAGVAWFKSLFPKDYYAYDAGSLQSVQTSAHKTVGFNQWDEEWEIGNYDQYTGAKTSDTSRIRSKNPIKVLPSTQYYIKAPATCGLRFYDASGVFLSGKNLSKQNQTFYTPSNAYYMNFSVVDTTTYNHDICISLSWSGYRNGEYEPYEAHTYALDDSLTLRGIQKLDANNKLYYDGDEYKNDGTVKRRYGIVDLGTLNWNTSSTVNGNNRFTASLPVACKTPADTTVVASAICNKYLNGSASNTYNEVPCVAIHPNGSVFAYDDSLKESSSATFKTAMSGVYLVYELATPTTESATAFTAVQSIDPSGTEEYVDAAATAQTPTRDVAIPVGHYTNYANVCEISGRTSANAYRTGKNLYNLANAELDKWINSSTGVIESVSGFWFSGYIPVVAGQTYYKNIATGSSRAAFYDSNKNFVLYYGMQSGAFTVPSGASYFGFCGLTSDTPYDAQIQIEVGSIATPYEPYTGITYPITWSTTAGTVYGGTVDLVSGKLRARPQYASYNGETLVGPWMSSMDAYVAGTTPTIGAQVVDLGGTETEYTLAPQTVAALLGQNYVWSDSGDLTVTV